MNHEQEDHSVLLGSSVLLCNLSSTSMHVQQWHSGKNVCVMEGYCGRQCRQYKVAMEIGAGKAGNYPLYLHHPHCSWITRCQGVGQLEKSINVWEVDAKKSCWVLCEKRGKILRVCESLGLYVGWLCEVLVADKRGSTFPYHLLTTFMTHFRPWQVHMCMIVYFRLHVWRSVAWFGTVRSPSRRAGRAQVE